MQLKLTPVPIGEFAERPIVPSLRASKRHVCRHHASSSSTGTDPAQPGKSSLSCRPARCLHQ